VSSPPADLRPSLRADCSACTGLCCVVPAFARSADFAIDKPAGVPCPNLAADARCSIHASLRPRGFPGCAVFDCFGAGQRLTAAGLDAGAAAPVFAVARQLHELLWYLSEARVRLPAGPLRERVADAAAATSALVEGPVSALADVDPAASRRAAGPLLAEVSAALRDPGGPRHRDADLVGARLGGADLRAADLRGAYLIGADLRRADLRGADLLGADLRAADLRGARLDDAVFLTQPQLEAATGDAATSLTPPLTRPAHWAPPATRRRRP
jgi:hypothetical protein